MKQFRKLPLTLVACALLASACGGKQKEPETPTDVEVDNSDEFDQGMEMMQEFGGMNEEKVTRVFSMAADRLQDCVMQAGNSRPYLAGGVAFLVKVDQTGKAVAAHAERSTLGSYEAERCMLDVLKGSRWPKPVGGLIGLARSSIEFEASVEERPPVDWSESDIADTLSDSNNASALSACGSGGPFEITAYVAPSGKVLSVGVAHTDDNGDATASCLVDAVGQMKFGSPGSWRAKVTFSR